MNKINIFNFYKYIYFYKYFTNFYVSAFWLPLDVKFVYYINNHFGNWIQNIVSDIHIFFSPWVTPFFVVVTVVRCGCGEWRGSSGSTAAAGGLTQPRPRRWQVAVVCARRAVSEAAAVTAGRELQGCCEEPAAAGWLRWREYGRRGRAGGRSASVNGLKAVGLYTISEFLLLFVICCL